MSFKLGRKLSVDILLPITIRTGNDNRYSVSIVKFLGNIMSLHVNVCVCLIVFHLFFKLVPSIKNGGEKLFIALVQVNT